MCEPSQSYGVEKRRNHRNCMGNHAISVIPPLLNTITKGGGGGGGGGERGEFTKKREDFTISQLSALATRTPILGRVAQGDLELYLPQIRKCHF